MNKGPNTPRPEFIDNDALHAIRRNADWQKAFIALGIERVVGRSKAEDWWAKSPFNPDERTPSFHMSSDRDGSGRWYCHSTAQGGGLLDLVQKLQGCNIYEAGRWLLDHQCSYRDTTPAPPKNDGFTPVSDMVGKIASSEKEKSLEPHKNAPIRQSLVPLLTEMGTHPVLKRRGISQETCAYLGCGYLPKTSKSGLRGRLVFQVRGIDEAGEKPRPHILTHIGRSVEPDGIEQGPKWMFYKGFHKALELYNIDKALLDPEARRQAKETGKVLLVEGPFDVAKCVEAGLKNVVACFGSDLSTHQAQRLKMLSETLGIGDVVIWFDRDDAGRKGQVSGYERLETAGLKPRAFAWDQSFPAPTGEVVPIPEPLMDPCDFTSEQLRWLRRKGVI